MVVRIMESAFFVAAHVLSIGASVPTVHICSKMEIGF